jgi:hypothetical protein
VHQNWNVHKETFLRDSIRDWSTLTKTTPNYVPTRRKEYHFPSTSYVVSLILLIVVSCLIPSSPTRQTCSWHITKWLDWES